MTASPATDTAPAPLESRGGTDLLLLLMAVIWGVNFSVLKFGTRFVSPLAFNGTRIALAAASQVGLATLLRLPTVERRAARRLVVLGMLGNGVYQVLFILGVVRSSVATAALIVASTPAFIAILGRLMGVEALQRRQWGGIALQVLGCASVVLGSGRAVAGADTPLGAALLLLASSSWALYSVVLRRDALPVHPLQVGGYTMLGGALVSTVVAIPAIAATDWTALALPVYAALFYGAIIAMVIAYLFWYRGLRVLGPTRTALYSNLQPLIAAAVAYVTLREVPTGLQAFGGACVVSGLLLARRPGAT